MARILILDDDKSRHMQFSQKYRSEELTHVHTSHDCIRILEKHDFDYVFLDHDLGGKQMEESGPGTGYEVAEWIANNPSRKPSTMVILHSLNPVGRKNMCNVLKSAEIKVMESPFLWRN